MGLVVCDPVAVDEGEGVEGFLPAVDAADEFLGLALLVLDNEVEDFQGGLFVGECPRRRVACRNRAFVLSIMLVV